MTDRLLVDVSADGLVTVSTWLDGELPSLVGEPVELAWPLTGDELEDLRWYLEDYLCAPFGVYEQRGPQVASRLPEWGQRMFRALFSVEAARDAYVALRTRAVAAGAAARPEVVVRSAQPGWLGLPWELLSDPAQPSPMALDAAAVSRSLPTAQMGQAFSVGGERLRVLMVISRPLGTGDVGYRMIARPLLERLDAVRGAVELVVLRPPTVQALVDTLQAARAAGEPFQVVHFDGHGVLSGRRAGVGPPVSYDATERGMLVFEKPGGGADPVPAENVAQVLAVARVPVVVLNACQSGAIGKQLEAAVATRLLAGGASSVVAMAYSVYAVAAAEFMTAFYERLFAGDRVSDAVTAGRARLARNALRPSPKGKMPLSDWVVPVHYLRRDAHFPYLRERATGPRDGLSLDAALDRIRDRHAVDPRDPLAPREAFVGRDGQFYTLEVAVRLQRVVVLHGSGGTGKTELAKAFGRWWRDTGGVEHPELVIWHSFEPGVASFGLDGVLSTIGLQVYGVEFARLDAANRRGVVRDLLARHRVLVVFDNFESVHSMSDPTAATPPLDEADRVELTGFLAEVAATGPSAVIITSRSPETWLGDIRRIPVAGLNTEEASDYADQLLAPYPNAAPRRAQRVFGELMEWLDGHPLSMRLILPQLDTTDPVTLLAGLRGTTALPGGDDGGRTTSLPACITYSIAHLDPTTRQLLAAVCLFHGVTDAVVLGLFSQRPQVPGRFRDTSTEIWKQVLDHAAGVGLLTPLGAGMYGIHPALPSYLADQWRVEDPDTYAEQRAAADQALLDAHAALAAWLEKQIQTGDAALAFTIIDRQRRTLSQLLGTALDSGNWDRAGEIAGPLIRYWDARGLYIEARGWVDRACVVLEDPDGTPPNLATPAGALWLFLVGSEANRQQNAGQLDDAEYTYAQIRHTLLAQPTSPQQRSHLATCYHQLGMVAQLRGRLDDAEDWYQKSLTIKDDLGDRPDMASSYHQLGIVAQLRRRLDDAEDWYQKSLTIADELGDRPGMATSYHQLGMVAQDRGRLDDAEDWYQKSLTILEELGDRPGMAMSFGQLGLLAETVGRPQEALAWTVRCVSVFGEFPHPSTGPAPQHLARLTAALGVDVLRRCWLEVTGQEPPPAVISFIQPNQTKES